VIKKIKMPAIVRRSYMFGISITVIFLAKWFTWDQESISDPSPRDYEFRGSCVRAISRISVMKVEGILRAGIKFSWKLKDDLWLATL